MRTGWFSPTGQSESYLVSGRTTAVDREIYEHCENCDFIQWGWWGTRIDDSGKYGPGQFRRSEWMNVNGTWVAGNISDTRKYIQMKRCVAVRRLRELQGHRDRHRFQRCDLASHTISGDRRLQHEVQFRRIVTGLASINNFDGNDGLPINVGGISVR